MGLAGRARTLRALLSRDSYRAMSAALAVQARMPKMQCPCCGTIERFSPTRSNRLGARCPHCGSLERHRLFKLAYDDGFASFDGKSVLHFAPEPIIARMIRSAGCSAYTGADVSSGRADVVLNIEAIDMPSCSFDSVICFHVLEHVDDTKAIMELYRVIRPGGELIAMVPLIEGWQKTYESSLISNESEREIHFGQFDHLRYYGGDFRDRLIAAGFILEEYTANGASSVKYGLIRGEKVFKCVRPL